ncbi:hypothetical protein TCAL_03221 [Tigriopus californicus]|uniref:SET domain-containing protein n=1 Tax=Tigriopus californicus TaxID=6832 RepID=A0A553NT55_TIGCA|nr:histone-lysine N-methyltransferase SETD7-like [Tigriopus californicus]XP_059084744.1 histone-lysine N-methyltransferase SETD7-like [Tigriopus californicus]XP_059084751.1 histone-lysine N-methyltransferase SETD7-like [Tigriopus californicus]TRY68614.1 hypothetical protein TCAL_03221 [Tigriopus californicus]|eukprot:TCALIF_03221-PA protein Name:"Similar to setd7 Histone-lysine N-methyltransferase SETD7 (Halocynthia roretzi)" AED:0.00 eAED:0.00 QI:4/1/1/1/1/1/2/87/551
MSDSGRFTSSSLACYTAISEDEADEDADEAEDEEEDNVTVTSRFQGRCAHLLALLQSGTLKKSLKRMIPDDLPDQIRQSHAFQTDKLDNKFPSISVTGIDEGITDTDLSDFEEDSGVVVSSEDDEPDLEDECPIDCACFRFKSWLLVQGQKDRNILDDDYYTMNKSTKWPDTVHDKSQCNFDPYPSILGESFRYAGERDRFGRLHRYGSIYFANGRKFIGRFKHGIRQGPGELIDREGSKILSGIYAEDKLQGVCSVAGNDGGLWEITFHKGVPHGPGRRYNKYGVLQWVGRYLHGVPSGICWRSNDNEGWYVGTSNAYGRVTGNDVIYMYPDFHTALVGKWSNECMKEAYCATVVGLDIKDGFPYPILGTPDKSVSYKVDVSGYSTISTTPLLPDPYETKFVKCMESTVACGGDGLFAARDIQADTVLSFYNGTRFHDCHAFNDWDYNSYKIRLNEKKKQILDIPPEHRSTQNYCASLAHKVNHSFAPNARFSDFCHPRFGRILCVKSTKKIRKGAEIFCNYGYNLADCPEWYKDLHESLFFGKCASIIA